MVSARLSILVLASLAGACIADPSFVLDEAVTSTDATTPPSGGDDDDEMVQIPATVLSSAGTLAPAAPPGEKRHGDEDKEKGKPPKGGGSNDDAGAPPAPTGTTITVPTFWIDAREVSAGAYERCVEGGACTKPLEDRGCTLAAGLRSHPVTCITIDQARSYCSWKGKRLVRNDEHTAAAAGAAARPYPWGSDAPSVDRINAKGDADGYAETAPRGSFPLGRTPQGVWDLSGNVAEWVDLSGTTVTRGGGFEDSESSAFASTALRTVSGASVSVGFRCAKDG